jgi:hypothetical protein
MHTPREALLPGNNFGCVCDSGLAGPCAGGATALFAALVPVGARLAAAKIDTAARLRANAAGVRFWRARPHAACWGDFEATDPHVSWCFGAHPDWVLLHKHNLILA